MSVNYLETGSLDPCYNLAFEEYVLKNRVSGDWLLLWQNENTVVVGLNQNTLEEIDAEFVRLQGITVVRRETGGGAVYHDLGNLNYSFITDLGDAETLTIERFTAPVCRALASMGVSAETTGRNDITVAGRKVSGVAQRICRGRILHHGTLLFDTSADMIAGALRSHPEKFRSKSAKSVRSRVGNLRDFLPEGTTLDSFRSRLLEELTHSGLTRSSLSPAELEEVRAIAESKYRSYEWTYGRSPEFDYRSGARFEGGSIASELRVRAGLIEDAAFPGDYMAKTSNAPAVEALRGVPYRRDSVEAALAPLPLTDMFGSITLEDILSVMFGAMNERNGDL